MNNIKNLQKNAEEKFNKQTGLGRSRSTIPNPGISILFFLIITTILLVLKIVLLPSNNLDDFTKTNTVQLIILIVYVLLLLIGNYLINISITTELCGGTPQWGTSLIVTVLPWIVIFGILNAILIIFPGWLIPFSNTFGYFVVGFFGLNNIFNKDIISDKENMIESLDGTQQENGLQIGKALQQIYGNKSLLINEIPREGADEQEKIDNFQKFFETMKKLNIFKTDIEPTTQVTIYKLLKIKDYIAEYIWFILAGILVSSITYNYIVNVGCSFSSAKMKNAYDKYITEDLDKSSTTDDSSNLQAADNIFMPSATSDSSTTKTS